MTNEQLFNDHFFQNSKTFLAPKFENYKTYESQFARYTACESGLGGAGWELSNEIGVYCPIQHFVRLQAFPIQPVTLFLTKTS